MSDKKVSVRFAVSAQWCVVRREDSGSLLPRTPATLITLRASRRPRFLHPDEVFISFMMNAAAAMLIGMCFVLHMKKHIPCLGLCLRGKNLVSKAFMVTLAGPSPGSPLQVPASHCHRGRKT
ncbi:hypothetical protein E2C01_053674 [Portunus trituberculatus]|uniref:Uncharacterized protein n=1 Tax=Portunus trituberculatus TaxID=210409 RepID=A0A5B7GHE7_PORTR|nr:hypothetical protein [Portunus trituberculatus]